MSPRPLILASRSPQRKHILKELRVPFKIIPSHISERTSEKNPRHLVAELALRKAAQVARRHARGLVLGADTIVCCKGEMLFKPKSRRDSLRILSLLNGAWHRVYTGVALVDAESGKSWGQVTVTKVKARRLGADQLSRMAGRHMDKAGSYAVQDKDDPFIERIVGPLDNVIGLPLASVRRLIRKAAAK